MQDGGVDRGRPPTFCKSMNDSIDTKKTQQEQEFHVQIEEAVNVAFDNFYQSWFSTVCHNVNRDCYDLLIETPHLSQLNIGRLSKHYDLISHHSQFKISWLQMS